MNASSVFVQSEGRHVLPNFLIIGAARSGTTTLYSYLAEHPDIYLHAPKRPEPHFFLKEDEYNKGILYYSDKYFSKWKAQSAIGEASTSYIFQEFVAERIQSCLPQVKLILALRQPVERAFSGYWHTVKAGLETLTFDEAVHCETERNAAIADPYWSVIKPFAYVERGFYYKQITAFLKYFPRERLHIILFDDLVCDTVRTVQQVCCFLGVDDHFVPSSLGRVENASTPPGAEISIETRKMLLEQYREDIDNLSFLLKRDLSKWKA